ncbi:MAG: transcriptional regulator [Burkholderiales bacterium 35-55-47]|nr:MAG: transcriptional regulator [Burkholderiales bacterium 35-55-47]OYZ72872.1 MAG: transcriptional regulator [Burkholderiales bacterium 24-55-52]OZA99456.1 MAG: transcriptional regulator [Burkholderiales bacterium 39-55-53]
MQTLTPPQKLMRTRDLEAQGWNRVAIGVMLRRGQLVRIDRGLYASPDFVPTDESSLAQVSIKYPKAVFCLLTALRLHGLTTQNPHEVWIAIEHKANTPKMDHPPLHIIRSTGVALSEGVEQITVDGVVQVPVMGIAKTIVDCFKFRNKIGLDVAIEALKEAWYAKKVTMDELHYFAKICRVENVMRPYMETLA